MLVELTVAQASTVKIALDVYSRLCIGQFDVVEQLVRDGTIPMRSDTTDRKIADIDTCDVIAQFVTAAKTQLGHPASGNMGIGNRHVHITGHRAWEVRKVLAKVLAEHQNRPDSSRGVDHDGLIVRYTQDPAPHAEIITPREDNQDSLERAFQIADESMLELLKSHAVPVDIDAVYMPVDVNSDAVATLDEADEPIQEAVEWLTLRGIAEVINGADGQTIHLLK